MIEIETILHYFGSNKKRTVLAVIGVAIGVFSLVLMMGITGAMKNKVNEYLGDLGSQVFVVIPGEVKNLGGRLLQVKFFPTLTLKDAKAIKERCVLVKETSPIKEVYPPVHANGKFSTPKVLGVDENYAEITSSYPAAGRFITKDDVKEFRQVAVIGVEVAQDLFGEKYPVGKTLYLYNAPYKIIGVLPQKGTDISGENLDNRVLVPISCAVRRLENVDYIDGIYVLPVSEKVVNEAMKEVASLLKKRHKKKDFSISRYEDLVNTQKEAMEIFSVLSVTVATIAFSVGALGILAVMTLSVYERLVEIGIRRAFGATKLDIFKQFLLEATILSLTGSVSGAVIATGLVNIIAKIAKWQPYIPIKGIFISIALSIIVGLIAGVYPAMRATSFEPKEILKDA
ncbi:ABC transporter permease [Desulfurobacterium sp.]